MKPRPYTISSAPAATSAEARVATYDWKALAGQLDHYGCAVLSKLLSPRPPHLLIRRHVIRVDEEANDFGRWHQLSQHFQPLRPDRSCEHADTRQVALGVAQALDETEAEGITCEEDDGDCRRRVPSRQCARWTAGRKDH